MNSPQLFDTLLEPVFCLDENQVVVYCNETAAILCQSTVRKIIRSKVKLTELLSFSAPIDGLDKLKTVTEATPYKELNFTTSEGGAGKVQVTVQPFPTQENDLRWIVFVRDVTLEERLQKKYRAELEQKEDFIKKLEEANVQLENYSKNLEKMVAERTAELSRLNQLMSALLDSLDQGFFIFNSDGLCLEISSKACQATLETNPSGKMIWDVFKLSEARQESFKKWMMTVFMEMLPFEDLTPLGPQSFNHSENKNIQLSYYPLRNPETQGVDGVVVVASDITSLVAAQKEAETEKAYAQMILNMVQKRHEMLRFINDSKNIISSLESTLLGERAPKQINSQLTETLFRDLHTLKGGSATFGVLPIAEETHKAEDLLTLISQGDSQDIAKLQNHVRVIKTQFSDFLDQAREILGNKALSEEKLYELPESELRKIVSSLACAQRSKSFSQTLTEKYFLGTLEGVFESYRDLALKLAESEGKEFSQIQFVGLEKKLPTEPLQHLTATLVHAFRNAVDHGLETPAERIAAGKPRGGHLKVSLSFTEDSLLLSIDDDGRGIQPTKIREKLLSKGIATSSETDEQVIQHIFDSQFSTRDTVTETSGRGVGMDAIKDAALKLGGKVWVRSQVGRGTQLSIQIPKEALEISAAAESQKQLEAA